MWPRKSIAAAGWTAVAVAGMAAICPGSARGEVIVMRREIQPAAISEQQFDAWVFQNAQNKEGCRKRLEAQLGVLLAEAARNHQLTEAQQAKLQLAGRGDMKRYFDQVEQHRDQFHKLKSDPQNLNEVFQNIQPLQQKLNKGLFEKESLFHKVLNQSLTDSQRQDLDSEISLRLERQTQAAIKMALIELEQLIPLTHKQRQALTQLLSQQVPPVRTPSEYTKYLMLYRISQIAPAQLEDTLDQAQLAAFVRYAEQGKAYAVFLHQKGLLSDQELHGNE